MIKRREWGAAGQTRTRLIFDWFEEEGGKKNTCSFLCVFCCTRSTGRHALAPARTHGFALINKKSAYETLKLHILKSRLLWASSAQAGVSRDWRRDSRFSSVFALEIPPPATSLFLPPSFLRKSKVTPLQELRQKMRILLALQVLETLHGTSLSASRGTIIVPAAGASRASSDRQPGPRPAAACLFNKDNNA